MTKRLLRDVRRVVSVLRSEPIESLEDGLHRLVGEVRRPQIHLEIDSGAATAANPGSSQAMLRCAQEVVTNAVRHSGADNLWLALRLNREQLVLEARDDGRGSDSTIAGHGLVGIEERLRALGGSAAWESGPGTGFSLRLWIPVPPEPSP